MKFIFTLILGMSIDSYSFAKGSYVNQFKLFNDFDKFLSKENGIYEVILNGDAEFYDDPKYSSFPDKDPKGEYRGTPEFTIKGSRLFHKDRLICDIKDGYPVPVNEKRPDNLTEMQNEMTICIYPPFIYYKKDYEKRNSKKDSYGGPNYSIRVILPTYGERRFNYQGKSYYRKRTGYGDREEFFFNPGKYLADNKKCKDELFSDEKFASFYDEVVSCGVKKDLDCLKKFLPVYTGDQYKGVLAAAKKMYGEVGESDVDLMLFARKEASHDLEKNRVYYEFFHDERFLEPYKNLKRKISLKELHRMSLVDNVSRLFKILPSSEFVCKNQGEKHLAYGFYNKDLEAIHFYKDRDGKFRFDYNMTSPVPYDIRGL